MHGVEDSQWGLPEQLLAQIADTVHWLAWTKTKDGSRNRNPPKPIPRPGVKAEAVEKIGKGALPKDEMIRWLAEQGVHFETE